MAGTIFAGGGFHGINYVEEDVFAVTPVNPAMRKLRHTSCSLVLTKDSFQSEELRSDRQIVDLRHGAKQTSGEIGIEFSFEEFEAFLSAAVGSHFTAEGDNRRLVTGVEQRSFTIERVFGDIVKYERFLGCMINTFALNVSANAIVTGTIGVIGADASFAETPLSASPAESKQWSAFDSFSGSVLEGGAPIATVTSIEFTIDNGIEAAFVVGKNSVAALTPGRINITGTLSLYFDSLDMLNKFVNEDDSTLVFTLGSGTSHSYTFTFPRIKYSSGDNPVDGEGPITLSMAFQAIYDPCTGNSFDVLAVPGPAAADCALTYSGTAFNESTITAGTITETHDVVFSGGDGTKYLTGNVGQAVTGASIVGAPDGLTPLITKVDRNTARISFAGTATAPITATTMTIAFTSQSFMYGTCGCPNGTITGMSNTINIVPA